MPARLLAALGALALALAVLTASAGAAPLPPAPVTLDSGWQFQPAGGAWRPAPVPGVMDASLALADFAGSVGSYRLAFTAPKASGPFRWALHFGQVRRVAHVWLNGRALGASSDPYLPFALPAPSLRPGAPNTLLVQVDSRKGPEPREGWWNWGGIVRPVTLVPQGPVTLADPALLPEVSCTGPDRCHASVLLDGWVTNHTAAPLAPRVRVDLRSPAGVPTDALATAPPLGPGQTARVRLSIPVVGPADLWAPGHPSLYAARIRTLAGNLVAQSDTMRVGLRSVTVSHGALLLNGRALQLSGASIEEDVPGRGPALTPADMDAIVSQLQALHANVTRAQYPLNPDLLDRLDAAGILVWSQAPIYHRDELLLTPAERSAALATLRGSVLSDRVHPSVLTHSVANELSPTPDSVAGTRAYLEASAPLVRDLDPSVPPSLDLLSYPGYPPQRTLDAFPLLGINNYFGWYAGRAPHATADIAGLAPYLRAVHAAHPDAALVMTEFGSEATGPGPAGELHSFAHQQSYIRQTLAIVRPLPFMSGAIYWTLREFAVKPHWVGGPGGPGVLGDSIHHKGLISYAGVPKPAFATLAAAYAATPLYRALPFAAPTGHPSPAPLLAALALLAAIAMLLSVQLWAFAGIRAASLTARWRTSA